MFPPGVQMGSKQLSTSEGQASGFQQSILATGGYFWLSLLLLLIGKSHSFSEFENVAAPITHH